MLDVGTDRQSLLDDPLYIGNRHPRVPAADYDRFLDAFVTAVGKLFPAGAAALGGPRGRATPGGCWTATGDRC